MSDEIFASRREEKDYIRSATLQNKRKMEDASYRDRNWERQKKRLRLILVWAAFVLLCILFLVFILRNRPYSTYEITDETSFPASANMKIYGYASGNLLVSLDSITYVKKGRVVYTEQINFKNPSVKIRGNFYAVYDKNGYQIQIYDDSGSLSTVKLSRQIRAMDISKSGVIAVFTESGEAAYVSYFDRYGTHISVELRTYLDTSGYPMNIAISGDAQKLLIPYYSTQNGIGESKLVLYDFEDGKEENMYIVGTFDDFYQRNTMLFDCCFLDDTHAVAVGDHELFFLTYRSGHISSDKIISIPEEIQSVFYVGDRVGVILTKDNTETSECCLYDCNGKCYSKFGVSSHYSKIAADTAGICFIDGKNVRLYNLSGKHRYTGTLTLEPLSVAFSNDRGIYISGGSYVSKIKFK